MANYCSILLLEAPLTAQFVAQTPTIPTVEIPLGVRTAPPYYQDYPVITLTMKGQTPTPEVTGGGSNRPTTGQIWPRSMK